MRLNATRLGSIASSRSFGDQLDDLAGQVPNLDLNFARNKSLIDDYSGTTLVTFTRASSGTFVGSDGLLRTAVTNLLLQSEDFSTTWVNTESTEASNVETAPNGTLTADKLIPDVGVTSGQFRQDVSKAATATTYTCSVYGKAAEFNRLSIRVEHNGSTGNRADVGFSLSDGSVVSAAAALGTFSGASATATSVGAGWYRFTLSFTSSTETSIRVRLFGFDSSLPCNGTSGIYLWGAQLEQSSTVGEYIPTTSTINSAPRFDHNPTTGESLGLLVEEARTNVLLNSATLSTQSVTVAAAANTLSFYGTGTVTLTGVSTAGPLVGTGANNRVSLTFTPTVGVLILTVSGSVTNAQLEAGAFATSYIPTAAATVTRAADVASITGTNFSSWYNQTEGTVFANYAERAFSVAHQVASASNGTSTERISLALNASNTLDVAVISGGTDTFAGNTPTLTAQEYRIGFGYKADSSGVSANGSAITVDSAVTLPTVSQLDIGARGSSQLLNSTIKRLTYWSPRLTDTTLQQITQP